MNLTDFKHLLEQDQPPSRLNRPLQALWYDAKGDWDTAHSIAQNVSDQNGSWVHAYLHRKEGDLANAGYWYRLAEKPMPKHSLPEEWEEIARALLTVI